MKTGFYPKLAWMGIRKNKRQYTPYILTCMGMIMMFYIMAFLAVLPLLNHMSGGGTIKIVLSLGRFVIGVFALIFLFYTNSFLVRRRKKEFGLYNILGMGKKNIARILCWETLIIFAISMSIGSVAGIALSKFAELGLMNIMQGEISYSLTISGKAIFQAFALFAVIFALILLNTLRQIHASNPVALLHSENTGEKPPKGNWFFGLLGVLLLGVAYYIALSIKDPLEALIWFFVAVIIVILATYLIFIAGSVTFCRILQKNKKYYYKSNHFVSVSSMVYRMKRNGAGLASICILGTMVLVMLSSSTCLYIGAEDSLRTRYPKNIEVNIDLNSMENMKDDNIAFLRQAVDQVVDENNVSRQSVLEYRTAKVTGLLQDGYLETDVAAVDTFELSTYSDVYQVYMVPLADYNRLMGTNEMLDDNQIMIYTVRAKYTNDTFTIKGGKTFQVKKLLKDFVGSGSFAMDILPSMVIILPDLESSIEPLMDLVDNNNDPMIRLRWYYGFDLDEADEVHVEIYEQMIGSFRSLSLEGEGGIYSYSLECAASQRGDFYATYGGLFFLGIMLSIVFIFAAVLIIYYKQISEGYEDQSRFEIMKKVGMTKKDIRKSINSQLLTVFFLPLITAGLHLAFAFPMIRKLLLIFNLTNLTLLILVTIISYLIFALFYTLVYRMTSNAYYAIVSGGKEA